jgi:protein-S-isoprenylcysteine O-methyltransferase Ste14
MTRDLAALALMWGCWCALHSAMITHAATDYLRLRRPGASRFYRMFFNAVSLLTLAPVLVYERSIAGDPLFTWEGPWRMPRLALLVAAAALGLAGARRYDLLSFLGLRQALRGGRESPAEGLGAGGTIDTGGVHRFVRHPWYLAALIVIWARELSAAALVSNAVLAAYLIAGTVLEERKLVEELGDEYRSYQGRVSMLLPFKYVASKLRGIR